MSWTNAVVTEAGLALQAKLVDGQTLGFLRVAAGTGTVDPASLANQTALVNEKQTLTFQPPNVLDDAKIKVPVMLNNIGLETGYTMQQLGFFADDPDDGEILYAIVQDEVGDTVPSQTESPGFVIEWAFVFQYGNAGSVTVTLDPVGLVSIGMVGQPGGVAGLGENGAVPIEQGGTGATTTQAALAALGAGVRPNLLDNADFRAGHVVNQRGTSLISTNNTYLIDRWKLYASGTVSLVPNGVQMQGVIDFGTQIEIARVEVGKPYTFSVFTSDGKCGWATHSFQGNESESFYQELEDTGIALNAIYNWSNTSTLLIAFQGSETLSLAKVEQGENQTLAYQDSDGAWYLLPQPESDYATQLAKCQRYFRRFPANYAMGVLQAASSIKNACFRYECNPPMRTTPVLLMQNQSDLTDAIDDGTSSVTPTKVVLGWSSNENVIGFYFEGASGNGGPGFVCNRYIDASAEL